MCFVLVVCYLFIVCVHRVIHKVDWIGLRGWRNTVEIVLVGDLEFDETVRLCCSYIYIYIYIYICVYIPVIRVRRSAFMSQKISMSFRTVFRRPLMDRLHRMYMYICMYIYIYMEQGRMAKGCYYEWNDRVYVATEQVLYRTSKFAERHAPHRVKRTR